MKKIKKKVEKKRKQFTQFRLLVKLNFAPCTFSNSIEDSGERSYKRKQMKVEGRNKREKKKTKKKKKKKKKNKKKEERRRKKKKNEEE